MALREGILGLLVYRELSGYDIKRIFDRSIGVVWNASDSQIYRELKALETEGLITARTERQERRPDKRLYRATESGVAVVDDWLSSPLQERWTKDEFRLRMFFFGKTSHEHQLKALVARRQDLLAQRERWQARLVRFADASRSQHPGLLWWQIRLLENTLELVQIELTWIEDLIKQVENGNPNVGSEIAALPPDVR
ncbi:MAG: hypothetical protein GEV10_28680 [Streptosporangiales bacterium]|nr:hypothetical protein [Streptosporangiales bacterium]